MKPILIVQHEADASAGHFERYLLREQLPHQTLRVFAREPMPRSAASYSGICSLGGSMSANDDLPWIDEELALMRDADRLGVPIIGHCLGGQLLAKSLGASVTRNAIKEIGWSQVEIDDPELGREWIGNEPTVELFQWHGDTFELPVGARRFLTSRWCANQAYLIDRKYHVHLGMQFHVEMTPELVMSWVKDPQGEREIQEAFGRQGGAGVQRPEHMLEGVNERVDRMNSVADRIYGRWTQQLKAS